MCNVKLAAAWRCWLAVVDQRHYLQEKLGSALNLFCNRRLTLAWQAWKVCCHAPGLNAVVVRVFHHAVVNRGSLVAQL